MRPYLLAAPLGAVILLVGASSWAQSTTPDDMTNPGGAGGTGGAGGGGTVGGIGAGIGGGIGGVNVPTAVDPNYDGRPRLALGSAALIGAPLGALGALGSSWWVAGEDGSISDTLLAGQVGALAGNALGVGAMLLLAWSTDVGSGGDAPFLIVPPLLAVAGGVLTPMVLRGMEGTPGDEAPGARWSLAPWVSGEGGGLGALGTW